MYKALLFFGAGKIIHSISGNQDIQVIGRLIRKLPLSLVCIRILSLALCGYPYLAGFYSEDLILDLVIRGLMAVGGW